MLSGQGGGINIMLIIDHATANNWSPNGFYFLQLLKLANILLNTTQFNQGYHLAKFDNI